MGITEFDVETTGFQWYTKEMFLAQFLLPGENKARILRHPDDSAEIQRLLTLDTDYRAWNAKFDLHFLDAMGYTLPDDHTWHDGMVTSQLMDERQSNALEAVGERLFGPSVKDDEKLLKKWLADETKRRRDISKETGDLLVRPNYSDVPDEIMYPYAGGDVELQRQICEVLDKRFPADLQPVLDLEREVLAALFDVERRGLNIDIEAAEKFEHQLENDLDRIDEEAKALAGVKTFNPRSRQQLSEALERRGVDLSFAEKLKDGSRSVNEETLEALDDDLAAKVLERRRTERIYTTYIYPMMHPTEKKGTLYDPYLAYDGRIHPNFRQVGARHGRMSAADPNVQNWHRDDLRLRYLVTPTDGNVLVTSDLDSVEMRLLGAFTGEGRIYDMAINGDDYHADTAKMVGLTPINRGEGVVESPRQGGKKFNYQMIFGGGAKTVAHSRRISQGKGRELVRRYREAYPEVVQLQDRIEAQLEDKGYVKTPLGRRQRVRDRRFVDREGYKFINYLISGTAADILKRATARIYREGVPMVTLVHDEIVADVPPEDAEEVGHMIREALIDQPQITDIVPLDADANVVERWSQAKDADFVPNYMKESA